MSCFFLFFMWTAPDHQPQETVLVLWHITLWKVYYNVLILNKRSHFAINFLIVFTSVFLLLCTYPGEDALCSNSHLALTHLNSTVVYSIFHFLSTDCQVSQTLQDGSSFSKSQALPECSADSHLPRNCKRTQCTHVIPVT